MRTAAQVDAEVAQARDWYEQQLAGLGDAFLDQVEAVFVRIELNPLAYRELQSGLRRALMRRFPYAVYFACEPDGIVILALLHVAREANDIP